ncbi:MAG: CHAT domain-containing tetratricopeptide repeat protein [Bryobacteraceae bacterium]|nr:CHAT domain-containing tetratricopeptide repeat protein [Bryobacteraceae bacterium]
MRQSDALASAGKWAEAQKLLDPLVSASEPTVRIRARNNLCALHLAQSKLDLAETCWKETVADAEASNQPALRLRALSNLPTVARRKGQYAQAAALYEKVIETARTVGDAEIAATTHDNLGLVRFQLGLYEESFAAYDAAGRLLAALDKPDKLAAHYIMYGDVLRVSDRVAEAEQQTRAGLVIADKLGDKRLIYAALAGLGNITRMRGNTTRALHYLQRALALAKETNRTAAMAEITNNIGYVYYLMGDDEQSVAQYRQALKAPGDPLVERAIRGRLALPLIELKRYSEAETEISQAIAFDSVKLAVTPADLEFGESASDLYKVLIAPAGLLPPRVVIVPDGSLWDLPFQALRDTAGRSWMETAELTVTPSLAALQMLAARPSAGPSGTPLFVAHPAVPDSAAQAATFASSLKGARVVAGPDATEARIKALLTEASLIHFTAHGVAEPGAPWYSRLELTASPGEDGMLEAWEIARAPLKARLAVLAACETGRGRVLPGEGLIGLGWAFLGAGVGNTVVSQWRVDSAATAALFTEFYRKLGSGASPSAALRDASLALSKDPRWRHPFYWAAFVNFGSAR